MGIMFGSNQTHYLGKTGKVMGIMFGSNQTHYLGKTGKVMGIMFGSNQTHTMELDYPLMNNVWLPLWLPSPLPPPNPPLYTPLLTILKGGTMLQMKFFWKIFLGFRVFFQKVKKNFWEIFQKFRGLLYFTLYIFMVFIKT